MSIVHIPFYPSDWLSGTRGLSDVETGVYITLVARMYEMAAPIERDDQRLYRLCGSKSKAAFVKSLEYLMSEGKIIETEDGLFNEKVQKVIKETTEKSDKAKAAAQSRWDRKPSKNNGGSNADASVKHMPQPCQPKPKPEPYKKEGTIVPSVQPDVSKHFQDFWDAYPHRGGKKNRDGAKKAFAKCIKAGINVEQIAIGVRNMGNDPDVRRGFARDPTSWLNQSGWTDEFNATQNSTAINGGNYDPRNSNQRSGNTPNGARSSGHDTMFSAFDAASDTEPHGGGSDRR